MKVYGELEVAQLEGFATGSLPSAAANFRRMVYDTTANLMKVSDGTSWRAISGGISKYKFVVGAVAEADFTTLSAALIAHPSNTSFLLDSSYVAVENVTIAGNGVLIEGDGISSVIQGNVTINSGVQFTKLSDFKVTGNVTINSNASSNIIDGIWVASTSVVADNSLNDGNYVMVAQL